MAHGPIPTCMLKFATVAVVVRDEKKATKFWKDKVGFRVVTSWPHWVTVAPRGSNVHLHLCPDARPEKGNTGYMFSTQDAKRVETRLRALEEPSRETFQVGGGGQVRDRFRRLLRGFRREPHEEPHGSGEVAHQIGLENAGVEHVRVDRRPLESARQRVREQEIRHLGRAESVQGPPARIALEVCA